MNPYEYRLSIARALLCIACALTTPAFAAQAPDAS